MSTPDKWQAPAGAVWVCGACGKYGKQRDRIGDESCFLKAILCREESIRTDHTGRAVAASAVEE